jgi:hypothetical protein
MIYENGKWTLYTTDNTKFELTEEQFADIFWEFKEQGTKDTAWFEDVIEDKTEEVFQMVKKYETPGWCGEWCTEFDERVYTNNDMQAIVKDVLEDLANNYYFIKREQFAERLAEN